MFEQIGAIVRDLQQEHRSVGKDCFNSVMHVSQLKKALVLVKIASIDLPLTIMDAELV